MVLDSWKRGGDRTNSNYVIMGTAGVGKSTVAKHLILNEYMTGTKLLAIDQGRQNQDEYRRRILQYNCIGRGRQLVGCNKENKSARQRNSTKHRIFIDYKFHFLMAHIKKINAG